MPTCRLKYLQCLVIFSSRSLVELAIWVCKGNVANGKSLLLSELSVRLHHKLVEELIVGVVVSNRHHNDSTWFQLVDESLRHCIRDCSRMYDIIGGSVFLTKSPISTEDFNTSILELLVVALR